MASCSFCMYNIVVIKILTGWSNPGGSTESFIRMTNELNNRGFDTMLYGPHDWHLDKCKSDILKNEMTVHPDDIILIHFLDIKKRLPAKKFIYVCHEKNLKPVGEEFHHYDACVFLHEKHREYHSQYKGPSFLIPNLFDSFEVKKHDTNKECAGVVGSIDINKRTHVSIQRAKKAEYKRIYIYGEVTDTEYYQECVEPLIDNEQVIFMGFKPKSEIYSSIGAVFLSSKSECAPLVLQECYQTKTKFYGYKHFDYDITHDSNDEIIDKWIEIFK